MPMIDDVLKWIETPLEDMKKSFTSTPDVAWTDRRATFLQQLGLHDSNDHPVIGALLERLDGMSEDERNDTFGTGRIDIMTHELAAEHAAALDQAAGGAGPDASYDQGAWQEFLLTDGPRWDGADASWAGFREWFLYYASAADLGAQATQLLDYMDRQSAGERVTTFAQYGVTILVAADPTSGPTHQAAEQSAPAEASQASADTIMNELIGENPEFESIPPERRQQIIDALLSARQSGD
jgi:hypothetical protein